MNAVATKTTTTTLFDLIASMQENATGPADEAMIVPTVANWLRAGRITFKGDHSVKPAA